MLATSFRCSRTAIAAGDLGKLIIEALDIKKNPKRS
jgi:hypothetical protein